MAQLMPLPLTVFCFRKIQTGFTFLVLAHPDSPEQRAVKRVFSLFLAVSQVSAPRRVSCGSRLRLCQSYRLFYLPLFYHVHQVVTIGCGLSTISKVVFDLI